MEFVNGTLGDLLENITLIRKMIPKKSSLTAKEIVERLSNKEYGVKIATENNQLSGIFVWYEENDYLYLWLGAIKEPGNGVGTEMLKEIEKEVHYPRWFVKTALDNYAAIGHLQKNGFNSYNVEKNIIYLEKFF